MVERAYGDGRYLVEIVPGIGPHGNNAYILSGPNRGAVTIIDAPGDPEAILAAVGRRRIDRIVVTHSHPDHWAGFDGLRAATAAPVFAGAEETDLDASRGVRLAKHGDTFDVGGATARVLHTPGHTPGSICLHFGGSVLAGDTLFPGGPGQTQSNAALQQEIAAIRQHLFTMQPDTVVLPGHGGSTTIAKAAEEYAVFAGKSHAADLCGDVRWLES